MRRTVKREVEESTHLFLADKQLKKKSLGCFAYSVKKTLKYFDLIYLECGQNRNEATDEAMLQLA